MIKLRRSHDRLKFIMEIPVPGNTVLYWERVVASITCTYTRWYHVNRLSADHKSHRARNVFIMSDLSIGHATLVLNQITTTHLRIGHPYIWSTVPNIQMICSDSFHFTAHVEDLVFEFQYVFRTVSHPNELKWPHLQITHKHFQYWWASCNTFLNKRLHEVFDVGWPFRKLILCGIKRHRHEARVLRLIVQCVLNIYLFCSSSQNTSHGVPPGDGWVGWRLEMGGDGVIRAMTVCGFVEFCYTVFRRWFSYA